jgi:UDP-galactopyranose mutase
VDWRAVATPPIERVLGNVILDRDDVSWGPNATFKYPRYGGTGELFDRMRPYVEDQLRLCSSVASVDVERKRVRLRDGRTEPYDLLLSTMPLDVLVASLDGDVPDCVRTQAGRLRHSGSYIVGVGIEQECPSSKCWMYFPEANCPFYRLTYLSNYSPDVVPDATRQYSILAEISHSVHKPVNRATVVEDTIQGLVNTRMISEADRRCIVDAFLIERDYTYPTPSLERDEALNVVQPWLEEQDIYSRGRFGAWRYEVGNMDHSVAQGVEWVNRALLGDAENETDLAGEARLLKLTSGAPCVSSNGSTVTRRHAEGDPASNAVVDRKQRYDDRRHDDFDDVRSPPRVSCRRRSMSIAVRRPRADA